MKTTDLYYASVGDIPGPVFERFKKLLFDLGSLEAVLQRAPCQLGSDGLGGEWELQCYATNEAVFSCKYYNTISYNPRDPSTRTGRVRSHIMVRRLVKQLQAQIGNQFDVI